MFSFSLPPPNRFCVVLWGGDGRGGRGGGGVSGRFLVGVYIMESTAVMPAPNDVLLDTLNNKPEYNLNSYPHFIKNVTDPDLTSIITNNSLFYDTTCLINIFANCKQPLYLSLNIQSLQSKFNNFNSFINQLLVNKVNIDAIALQETWNLNNSVLLLINGFQPIISNTRKGMRGGGVGFYIRNGINFKILDMPSASINKSFESITIELTYPNNKKILFSRF